MTTSGIAEMAGAAYHNALVADHYGAAAETLGYSNAELQDAFQNSRTEDGHAVLDVKGIPFDSYRAQIGVLLETDRSRGGLELSESVTEEKVLGKAIIMHAKQVDAATILEIASGQPIDVGGKGGIMASREELEEIGPDGRVSLFQKHAEAHGINPYTNVTATDIGTFSADMDAIAAGLTPKYGNRAGGAASGVGRQYGGEPELHAPRTGLGGSRVLDHYLRDRARQGDERVIEAIHGGRPLTVLIQGLGKAGAHFLDTLPPYVQPMGAMERNGAIVAKPGEHLDRDELAEAARTTGLGEESTRQVDGGRWLPPSNRSDFWAAGADIIVPAFDRNQFTAEDALAFDGMAIGCLANEPVTHDAYPILADKEVDVLPDSRFNIGGTISSRCLWDKIVGTGIWTPESYEHKWQTTIDSVASAALQATAQLRLERGTFVSIPEAAKIETVERAVQRLRAVA